MAGRGELLQRSRQARRRRLLLKWWLALFVILALLVGFIYLMWQPFLRIEAVVVNGNKSVSQEEIKSVADNQLDGSYFWLLPRNNRFFYAKESIKRELATKITELENIDLSVDDRVLKIAITERQSQLLWCQNTDRQNCLMVDGSGLAFEQVPEFLSQVSFAIIAASGTPATSSNLIGTKVLHHDTITNVLGLADEIAGVLRSHKGFLRTTIVESRFDPAGDYVFSINSPDLIDNGTWELLVSAGTEPKDFGQSLEVLLNSAAFVEKVITPKARLRYIDAKLPNKLFFKVDSANASIES